MPVCFDLSFFNILIDIVVMVGLLLYLSVLTRPDISYALWVLTRHLTHMFLQGCMLLYLNVVVRVLNYLSQHHSNYGIMAL